MRRGRSGSVLLESLVALTMVVTAGVALLSLMQAGMRSETRIASEERTYEEATTLLGALSLLNTKDLDQRIGGATIGRFALSVTRPEPSVYRVSLARASNAEKELVVTLLYRGRP